LKSALRRSFPEDVSNGGWVVDWLWTLEEFGGSNFKLGSYQPGFSFATLPVTSIGPKKEIHVRNGKRRRAWTSVQVRELKSMARKKTPARKIAKSLKRTEGATRQKAFSLGLSLDTRA
jgi:hypothetical protein